MAIAFDAASTWTSGNPVSSLNISHTVGSGSNRMLFALTLTTNSDVAAKYNNVSMTAVKQIAGTGFDSRYWTLFCLPNPDTGTFNIVVTATSGVIQGGGASYSGVLQSTTMNASDSGTNASTTTITGTVTTVADNCWQILGARFANNNIAAGTGSTQRSGSTFSALFDSNGAKTPPGSTSMTATSSGGAGGAYYVMVSFAPAVDGPPEWYMSLI